MVPDGVLLSNRVRVVRDLPFVSPAAAVRPNFDAAVFVGMWVLMIAVSGGKVLTTARGLSFLTASELWTRLANQAVDAAPKWPSNIVSCGARAGSSGPRTIPFVAFSTPPYDEVKIPLACP